AVRLSLFATLAAILLGPQAGQGQVLPADPPTTCTGCPTCGCVQKETHLNSFVSGTAADAGQTLAAVQVRSAFGPTLRFWISYNTYDADGSRNMFTKLPGAFDTVLGLGWTYTFNDLLFTQHNGDMF